MPSSLPLFAFGWLSPAMLGWLAAAAAPLLIHLLSRRRYRETSWAAMEYLLAAMRQQRRRIRFEQWLLLAVRTLLVVLVVLAVAEPYLESAGLAFAPGGRVHRVLVFDGSYSMAYKPADKTRFDRAKELARRIVEESSEGDAFTLVLMSSSPRLVVATPAVTPAAILQEIDNLQLPHAGADLPAAVAAVGRLVEGVGRENPRLVRHEVYFLTDLQRVTWAPKLSEPARAEFLRQTGELAQEASLLVIDVGQPGAENLAVTALQAADPPVTVGREASLLVRLQDFGRHTHAAQPVELFVDGRRIERKEVEVPAGGSVSVGFSYRFQSPGDHAIEVRAPGDALEVDNRRFLAVPVREAVRALLIDGRPAGGSFRGAADYLAVALAPRAGQDARVPLAARPPVPSIARADKPPVAPNPPFTGQGPMVQAEVAPESALLERNLGGYDCLFLCNVAQFTASEAQTIDAYLQGGGNVVFFLGDQVLADRYNRELGVAGEEMGTGSEPARANPAGRASGEVPVPIFSPGQGRAGGLHVLPAQIGPRVDRPQFRLDPLGYRHPILQAFRGRGQTSLLTTPVFKHYKLVLPAGSPAATVLKLSDGDPLIVEQPVHRGRVVLVATSAEPSWTALPLWPSFVPLAQEIVAYCTAGQLRRRNVTVGEPLEALLALPAAGTTVGVQSPDGRLHPVQPRAVGDCSVLSYADAVQSGIYVVRAGPPPERDQTFAVNVDTAESDLAQADPDELRSQLWPGIPFTHRTSWQDAGSGVGGSPARGGSRLHVDLLYAVLGLLFFETWLGWKMGYNSTGH